MVPKSVVLGYLHMLVMVSISRARLNRGANLALDLYNLLQEGGG
jgi:hypothetical protein